MAAQSGTTILCTGTSMALAGATMPVTRSKMAFQITLLKNTGKTSYWASINRTTTNKNLAGASRSHTGAIKATLMPAKAILLPVHSTVVPT